MEQLMNGQRAGRIFATAGKIVAAINSGYKAIIRTPNGSTEVAAIVRCKDCKWFLQRFVSEGRCIKNGNEYHKPDWYCADGERR